MQNILESKHSFGTAVQRPQNPTDTTDLEIIFFRGLKFYPKPKIVITTTLYTTLCISFHSQLTTSLN
jgi:hypothetical protein